MKLVNVSSVVIVALCALVCMVYADDKPTTEPPELCEYVCPSPLPEETIYVPSPERCEDYCQCDPRGAILMHCPVWDLETQERLYFNPEKFVCDWPEVSGCVNEPTDAPTDPPTDLPTDPPAY